MGATRREARRFEAQFGGQARVRGPARCRLRCSRCSGRPPAHRRRRRGGSCDSGTPVAGQPTQTTYTCNVPTGTIGGYEVRQWFTAVPNPLHENNVPNGFITHMETDVVDDVTGQQVPIQRLMLHHIVFIERCPPGHDLRRQGLRRLRRTQKDFGNTFAPQRFYAAGEERAKMSLPAGLRLRGPRRPTGWGVVAMVMNHRSRSGSRLHPLLGDGRHREQRSPRHALLVRRPRTAAPIRSTTSRASARRPARRRRGRPARSARPRPAGKHKKSNGKKGKKRKQKPAAAPTTDETADVTFPHSGYLIAGAGHVHGGAIEETLTEPGCGNRQVAESDPTWGLPDHPFYNVRPILHEPGPINMSAFGDTTGLPVNDGETLRLNSIYDDSQPHVRVMGIMIAYFAPNPAVTTELRAGPELDDPEDEPARPRRARSRSRSRSPASTRTVRRRRSTPRRGGCRTPRTAPRP